MSPAGKLYASTGSSGTVRINSADPETFGNTLETLTPRADGRNKFGMHVSCVRTSHFLCLRAPLSIISLDLDGNRARTDDM